jgi:DNA polymerase-3 subunit alpha
MDIPLSNMIDHRNFNFTHLHVHSSYSLLGGTARVEDLVNRAALQGFKSLALTDTNALYGAVVFSKTCRKAGIQPILGMVIGISEEGIEVGGNPGRLVLLASNPEGYRSLSKLSSKIQGHAERESLIRRGLELSDIEEFNQGLICLSGGRLGWIERLLRGGDRKAAYHFAGRLAKVFDRNFYLSLEIHREEDVSIAKEIEEIGRGLGLQSVTVQPVYYLQSEDAPKLRLLAAIDHNCTLTEVPAEALPDLRDSAIDLSWLSPEDMAVLFSDFPDSLEKVDEVAQRCIPALPDGGPLWPVLKLPSGQKPDEALVEAAHNGLEAKFGPDVSEAVRQRLEAELEAISQHGYAPLFLVVADIVNFARRSKLPVSTRGSVANSLVAYCAGITTVDPVEHNLLFERFLNPARQDLPDIDLDFCSRRRDEILEYVRTTYGADKVALVATISTMQPRSAVRETAKAFGLGEAEIGFLAKLVPRRYRREVTCEEMLEKVQAGQHREIIQQAFGIVGVPHHLSLHPGGVVITPCPVTDIIPVQWSPKGFLVTQYDHRDLEEIGLPKLDLLGIRALTVLADAAELVRAFHNPEFDLEEIPLNDARTGDLLARGESIGVFQCESFGAIRTLRQIGARTIRDLAIANAYFRPGPLIGGMGEAFIRRYRSQEPVEYLHPSLEPILGNTKGVLIFQEQVLRVAREIAGLSWEQADRLRRGISKVRSQEMSDVEDQFLQGCQRLPPNGHGLTRQQAQKLWEQVIAFSGFGFNQGHATAYAAVSYRSAYLKAYWPAAFLCARLADRGGYHHPAIYMAEARRLGICIRPPHVNHSKAKFTLSWEVEQHEKVPCLWMGLDGVRDLRQSAIHDIIQECKQGPFQDLRDLVSRVDFQAKELFHLIQCGGLDGLGGSRSSLLAEAEEIKRGGTERQMAFSFARKQVESESAREAMDWEMRVLGYPISVHPLDLVKDLPEYVPLKELSDFEGEWLSTVGVRLPGWTGGHGFFFGDRETFIIAQLERGKSQPPTWQPQLLRGQWIGDGMGTFWFKVKSTMNIEDRSG